MKSWPQYCVLGLRACLAGAGSFVLWSVWLALTLLLAVQIYVASSHELAVPGFLLRQLEGRLAATGLRLTVGRTSFDPSGRVLVEDARFFLPAFPEPVVTVQTLFLRLDQRALLTGGFEPTDIQISGATVSAPAQLTPSGRTEELLSGIGAWLTPARGELYLRRCSTRLAQLTVSAYGRIPLPTSPARPAGLPILEPIVRRFPEFCRQALALQQHLDRCEEPALHLVISPAGESGVTVDITALAREVALPAPRAATLRQVVATTQLRLPGDAQRSTLELTAAEVQGPGDAIARGVTVQLTGDLTLSPAAYAPRTAAVTLDALTVAGVEAHASTARLTPGPLPRLAAEITTRLLGTPLTIAADADLTAGSAEVRFAGAISPRVHEVVSARVGTNVRRFYEFESLDVEWGVARFGAGWKFEKLTARVEVPRMNSYGVIMEDGRAVVELEPGRFYSPEAYARVGEYFAHGTYEHNLRTQDFRFLLTGQLRPLAIGQWFGPWWPNFFRQFEFPLTPPEASVDVTGRWREGRRTHVFVFADTPKVVIRGAELDRVRTRLFIRPGHIDGLELLAQRDAAETSGTFTYRANANNDWSSLDFDLASNFDLPLAVKLLGPVGESALAPFRVAAAPEVTVRGTFFGPGAPPASENTLAIEARTTGEFRLYDFPVQDVAFNAKLRGSEILVERFSGTFAGGTATGNARVWGQGAGRRLGFNAALEGAGLREASDVLQSFLARRRGAPPPPPGRFVQERASLQLNVAASAEGGYDDVFSFRGDGNAVLQGPGLGEVPLLGLLSQLFTFTSLRFNEARGNFRIDGPKLLFPKIELRGANSAIDAHGDLTLGRNDLHFNAKVFPFQESGNVLKSVVGAVLTPLSAALEVKLTGTLDKPEWAFVMGPTNLLRSLTEGGTDPAKPADAAPVPGPAPTTPAAPAPAPPAQPPSARK